MQHPWNKRFIDFSSSSSCTSVFRLRKRSFLLPLYLAAVLSLGNLAGSQGCLMFRPDWLGKVAFLLLFSVFLAIHFILDFQFQWLRIAFVHTCYAVASIWVIHSLFVQPEVEAFQIVLCFLMLLLNCIRFQLVFSQCDFFPCFYMPQCVAGGTCVLETVCQWWRGIKFALKALTKKISSNPCQTAQICGEIFSCTKNHRIAWNSWRSSFILNGFRNCDLLGSKAT